MGVQTLGAPEGPWKVKVTIGIVPNRGKGVRGRGARNLPLLARLCEKRGVTWSICSFRGKGGSTLAPSKWGPGGSEQATNDPAVHRASRLLAGYVARPPKKMKPPPKRKKKRTKKGQEGGGGSRRAAENNKKERVKAGVGKCQLDKSPCDLTIRRESTTCSKRLSQ